MKEVAEAFGAFGGLVAQAMRMIDGIQSRGIGAGLAEGAPTAIANVIKAVDMADKGMYRDSKGRKSGRHHANGRRRQGVWRPTGKGGKEQRALGMVADDAALIRQRHEGHRRQDGPAPVRSYARHRCCEGGTGGQVNGRAEAEMTQWNKRNPEAGITIRGQDVAKRVQEMERDKELRTIKHAARHAGRRNEHSAATQAVGAAGVRWLGGGVYRRTAGAAAGAGVSGGVLAAV